MIRARVTRTALAIAFGVAALMSAKAAVPGNVFACYCTIPDSVAEYRTQPDVVIVAGTLTDPSTFRVERVYRGPIAFGPNPILVDSSSCGFPMAKGERWIMAARLFKGELRPSICDSRARVGGPGAAALLADIEAVYGAQAPLPADTPVTSQPTFVDPVPVDPTTAPATAEADSTAATRQQLALPLILGAVAVVVAVLFGLLVFAGRRGRPSA